MREWTDGNGRVVRHTVVRLGDEEHAAGFQVHHARYSCRFASDLWEHPTDGGPTAIGQLIGYRDGAMATQLSWVSSEDRHLLALFDPNGEPDVDLVTSLHVRVTGSHAPET